MTSAKRPEPAGFILTTTDPIMTGGRTGNAYDLVAERLKRGLWPIYEGTRNRNTIIAGSRLAFYVAGRSKYARHIVAHAVVSEIRRHRVSKTDPLEYLTDHPHLVLALRDIELLKPPLAMRHMIPRLSFCPENVAKWGVAMMGGARAVSKEDWSTLFSTRETEVSREGRKKST